MHFQGLYPATLSETRTPQFNVWNPDYRMTKNHFNFQSHPVKFENMHWITE